MDSNLSSNDFNYEPQKIVDICENYSKIQPTIISNLKRNFIVLCEIIKFLLIVTVGIFVYFIIIEQKKTIKKFTEHVLKGVQKTENVINNTAKNEITKINKNIFEIMKKFKNMENIINEINKTTKFQKKNKTNKINKINNSIYKNNPGLSKYLNMTNYSVPEDQTWECKLHDGFKNFKSLKESKSYVLCNGEKNKHICYYQTKFGFEKGGVLCELENVILDPTKFKYYSKCPNRRDTYPEISDFFFNMNCKETNEKFLYHSDYYYYFKHWDYHYYSIDDKIEEIGKNKTVLIISSRHFNIYHGILGVMNALSTMYIYGLEPENVQILLMEKCPPEFDFYYPFYSELISRGGDIIFLNELDKNKKYLIKHSINVPHIEDSPFFIYTGLLYCKYRTPPFKYLLHLISKYFFIPEFYDSLDYNDTIIRYSTNIKNVNDTKYTKFVTIQWRKPFPPDRKNQGRLMGNGPELLNKLQAKMKDNVLVRLADTSYLSLNDQIALMLKTDYLVGIHGAGFTLGPYLSDEAIIHEISIGHFNDMSLSICGLSGHRVFKDSINGNIIKKNGEYMYLNADEFVRAVLYTMRQVNF